MMNTDR